MILKLNLMFGMLFTSSGKLGTTCLSIFVCLCMFVCLCVCFVIFQNITSHLEYAVIKIFLCMSQKETSGHEHHLVAL